MNNDNLRKALEANRRFYAMKFPHIYGKGYNPDEPRDWHGRWTTGGGSSVTLHDSDGSTETRTGGSQAWRNNNPGNIRAGNFADQHGAIGSNNGFAVFPDEETGRNAVSALLKTPTYANSSIDDAVATYAPGNENNVSRNQSNIRSIGGFSGNEIVGNLSPDRFNDFVNAVTRNEGWIPGKITRSP
ncbi:MAG: hypothetical protein KGI29_06715 [Pseudomonadota bacterium]|nr:hypothetical protein [Pseudomonadota bacterium]MDE3037562.1 hypothetical protein [Pseudomonadota bacterium]